MDRPQELFDRQFQNEPVSQPCSASCMHHHSHPCERCGRQWGNVIPLNQQITDLKAQIAERDRVIEDMKQIAENYRAELSNQAYDNNIRYATDEENHLRSIGEYGSKAIAELMNRWAEAKANSEIPNNLGGRA